MTYQLVFHNHQAKSPIHRLTATEAEAETRLERTSCKPSVPLLHLILQFGNQTQYRDHGCYVSLVRKRLLL
jgi:hypothetical protein